MTETQKFLAVWVGMLLAGTAVCLAVAAALVEVLS